MVNLHEFSSSSSSLPANPTDEEITPAHLSQTATSVSTMYELTSSNTTQGVPRNRRLQHHILRKCSNVCRIGTFSHEVVFGQKFYNSEWKVYDEIV